MKLKHSDIEITDYHITTSMGKITPSVFMPGMAHVNPLPFLTDKEFSEFNTIGCTGKNNKGIRTTREEFLNSLGKGRFNIKQIKLDTDDFTERFTITRAYLNTA